MSYECILYNFDHGFKTGRIFRIGKYDIEISDEHCRNLEKLERNPKRLFSMDESLNRTVEVLNGKKGDIVETAKLRVKEKNSSIIYPEASKRSSISDFTLFLSFLTGRRVLWDEDLKFGYSIKYFGPIVNHNYFNSPSCDVEGGLKKIVDLGLVAQFYNAVQVQSIDDLPSICFYANSIIYVLMKTGANVL